MPTLVLDDGRPLGESGAILWYFGEGTQYVPEDRFERAKVLQWMFFEQYSHEPNIAVARFLVAYSGEADHRGAARAAAHGGLPRPRRDGGLARRTPTSWSPAATRSPTSRSTPTRTWPARAASTSRGYPAIGAWLERVAAQPGHVTIDA